MRRRRRVADTDAPAASARGQASPLQHRTPHSGNLTVNWGARHGPLAHRALQAPGSRPRRTVFSPPSNSPANEKPPHFQLPPESNGLLVYNSRYPEEPLPDPVGLHVPCHPCMGPRAGGTAGTLVSGPAPGAHAARAGRGARGSRGLASWAPLPALTLACSSQGLSFPVCNGEGQRAAACPQGFPGRHPGGGASHRCSMGQWTSPAPGSQPPAPLPAPAAVHAVDPRGAEATGAGPWPGPASLRGIHAAAACTGLRALRFPGCPHAPAPPWTESVDAEGVPRGRHRPRKRVKHARSQASPGARARTCLPQGPGGPHVTGGDALR